MRRTARGPAAAIAAALLSSWLLLAPPAATAETTLFPLAGGTRAVDIATGPDGNLWFTWISYRSASGKGVGRISTGGEVSEYPLGGEPQWDIGGIVAGADGNLWFANPSAGSIGHVSPSGQIVEFPLPDAGARPTGITLGPDGVPWFTETAAARIGRIDPEGKVSELGLPPGSQPVDLATGPDGALWVAERESGQIARVETDGRVTHFSLPGEDWTPTSIVAGSDGGIWFGDESAPRIGRIGSDGEVRVFAVPGSGGTGELVTGPDGRIWYAQGAEIGWIDSNGGVGLPGCVRTGCDLPITALAIGPEGGLWFAGGTRIVEGGGGGGHLLLLGEPGIIGRYEPPTQVLIGPRATRLRGRFTKIGLWCDGGSTGSACKGSLSAYAWLRVRIGDGRRERRQVYLGERLYELAPGTGRRVALGISRRGRRAIRRQGGLEVVVETSIHGGQGDTRSLVLHPPRRR
jgi:virginiamycin B lyase